MKDGRPKRYILIQPWFSAQGHPAQSLLNLGRLVPAHRLSLFWVSSFTPATPFAEIAEKLSAFAPVRTFRVAGNDLRRNTLMAGLSLLAGRNAVRGNRLFFVDGDIFAFCLLALCGLFWVFPSPVLVVLHGPDRLKAHPLISRLTRQILLWTRSTIFLRSPEHLLQWQRHHKQVRFCLLPPVEGVLSDVVVPEGPPSPGPLRLGVIGQIRDGKNIPQLLALGDATPENLSITVRGPLSERLTPELEARIAGRADVHIGFMSEAEMMLAARQQDYLSCLFEKSWDIKSESATFWLAVKVLRPVVSFDEGWVADMIRQTGCGIVIAPSAFGDLASLLPTRTSPEYARLLDVMRVYRDSLSPAAVWASLNEAMA